MLLFVVTAVIAMANVTSDIEDLPVPVTGILFERKQMAGSTSNVEVGERGVSDLCFA